MNTTPENNILFDDYSILAKLIGKSDFSVSANNDCDCSGYTSTSNIDDCDTNQITPSSGKTH